MSKVYCNFKFDNEDLKAEFIKLLPNIAPDIASFLKGGLEVRGIVSDPEIVVDDKKETIRVNMFTGDKGNVLVFGGDKVEYLRHSDLSEDSIYALFNVRTKNIELFVKRNLIDVMIGTYASFRALDDNWESATIPPKEAEMEVLVDDDPVMDAGPEETFKEVEEVAETDVE